MNAVVVDQDVLHLEVGLLAVLLVFKLDKGVLQAVAGLLVADDFAGEDLAEAREDDFEVFVLCDGVELAHEEDVFRGSYFGKGKVSDHLQGVGLGSGLPLPSPFFQCFLVYILFKLLVVRNPYCCALRL